MEKTQWVITEPGQAHTPRKSAEPKRKAPYAAKQRIRDGMSESQIEGIKIWNAWHDVLKENGLLEDKPE